MNRLNNFDLLRLLFASLVVISHANYLSGNDLHFPLFQLSEVGVEGFFLITGYLIAGSAERSPDIIGYFIRRISRIYPAYLAILLVQIAILLALASEPVVLSTIIHYFAVNFIFLNWLQPSFGNGLEPGAAINGSLWTLKIEMTFYALAPLLVVLARRYGGAILIILLVASAGFAFGVSWIGYDRIAKQAPGMLYLFVIGMMLRQKETSNHTSVWWWLGAGVLFVAIAALRPLDDFSNERWHSLYHVVEVGLLAAFVYIVALKTPPVRLPLDVSYGIYLWHYPIIQVLLVSGFAAAPLPLFLPCVCVLTLMAGVASAMTVERHGLRLGKEFERRLKRRSQLRAVSLL